MAGTSAVQLPPAASRQVVEDYVLRLAPELGDQFAFAMLVPWASPGRRPSNVVAADPALEGHWDAGGLESLARRLGSLLVPCTFETPYEKRAAQKLLEQLRPHPDACVFILQLLEAPGDPTREHVEAAMARHDALLELGAGSVLLDPGSDPERLRRKLELEREWFDANARRADAMMGMDEEGLQDVVEVHHELLWDSVPRVLMPGFAPIDTALVEESNTVGGYRLLHQFKSARGIVMVALRSEGRQKVTIKAYDKSTHVTAADLERIYREFRFLTDVLRHPHIIRCHGMLHSLSRVYFVLDFGGMKNMHQLLLEKRGSRLDPEDADDCATQVAGALEFCHSRGVVHRQVCPRHIVVEERGWEKLHCRLVDFFHATHCPEATTSETVAGDLPCVAPEVVLDGSYLPRSADCWSLGVVLLEAAGGLGSTKQAVGWREGAGLRVAAAKTRSFFSKEGSHACALAARGGMRSALVLAKLRALIVPDPAARSGACALAPSQRRASAPPHDAALAPGVRAPAGRSPRAPALGGPAALALRRTRRPAARLGAGHLQHFGGDPADSGPVQGRRGNASGLQLGDLAADSPPQGTKATRADEQRGAACSLLTPQRPRAEELVAQAPHPGELPLLGG